jgi:hypothetical protein
MKGFYAAQANLKSATTNKLKFAGVVSPSLNRGQANI